MPRGGEAGSLHSMGYAVFPGPLVPWSKNDALRTYHLCGLCVRQSSGEKQVHMHLSNRDFY